MLTRERWKVIAQVVQEPRRFYDGGALPRDAGPGEPPDPGADPRIVLERHAEEDVETFALERLARRSPLLAWALAGLVVVTALVTFAVVSFG